jgi:23S rRNA (uridine2552-2'-O)-methyltransferase
MKRPSPGGNRWADHYTRQARRERYPARSVYKLQEIQARFRLLRTGDRVLDLGCAPGSWLLYAAEVVGPTGLAVGLDLQPIDVRLPPQARALVTDVRRGVEDLGALAAERFTVLLSDMAPATSGNHVVDCARSLALCEAALHLAEQLLIPGGSFVCKLFQGEDAGGFVTRVQARFGGLQRLKPKSSRKASREIFVIGLGKR